MEEALASPILQLGALGILAVFMWLNMRQQGQQAEKRAHRDEWIEGLVERAFESQDAHMESWREVTKETITVYQQVGVAYSEMNDALQANCDAIINGGTESKEQHKEIDSQVKELSQTLDDLNTTMVRDHGRIEGALGRQAEN